MTVFKTTITRISGYILYFITLILDYIFSYAARFMPFARQHLLGIIGCLREINGNPFDDYHFRYKIHGGDDTTCPSCYYDMSYMYEDANYPMPDEKIMKYINISSPKSVFSLDVFNAHEWTVKCTCPICKTKFEFEDADY